MATHLPYQATTATGERFDISFPLHPNTGPPVRVSQMISAILEALDREVKLKATSNGDVLQALAMAGGALVVLILLQLIARDQGLAAPALPNLIWIGLLATALEQLSGYGFDNLSVPLTAGLLWQYWAH